MLCGCQAGSGSPADDFAAVSTPLDSPCAEISYLSPPGTGDPRHDPPLHPADLGHRWPPHQFYLQIFYFVLIQFLARITVIGNAISRGEVLGIVLIFIT